MNTLRKFSSVLAVSACLCGALRQAHADLVTVTKVGNPLYAPSGFALFSAPIDDGSSTFTVYGQTIQKILPPPLWVYNPANGNIGPGAAEVPVNPNDIITGVTANHYKSGTTFTPGDFSNGNAVILGFIVTPTTGAPTGVSPDASNGSIMPNSLYPMHQTGDTTRNGVDFDSAWTTDFGDINSVLSGLGEPTFAGFSRQPFFEAETLEFGPGNVDAVGNYTTTFHFRDTVGNGYDLSYSYSIVAAPEPTSLAISLATALLLLRRR